MSAWELWDCVTHARMQTGTSSYTYFRKTGLMGAKSSCSKPSASSSEPRREPGIDLEGKKPLVVAWAPAVEDGGEVMYELARLPRGVVMPGVMLDILKRFGRDKEVGKPLLSLCSGGVVGWLCLP
jgi:hypothetical protein